MPTEEFELLRNDPDLQSEPGPFGTLIFRDGDAYCVVGPDFVDMDESDCYAFGDTREQAIANYAARLRGRF
jgi:hypothetical protein